MKKILFALLFPLSLTAQVQQQLQNTLLDQAFWQGAPNTEAIKAEMAKGNSPSQLNAMSMDPVVMAINAGAPNATIEFLLEQPGNGVGKLTHDGRTYLHWAANRGNTELVEYLLKKGAKTDIMDSHGTTPLLFAVSSGQQNMKIYDLFLAHGANFKTNLNQDGANALLLCAATDKDGILTSYFISKGLSINSTDAAGNTIFSYAAKSGSADVLKALVQKGIKPSAGAYLMATQGGGRRGGPVTSPVELFSYLESLGLNPAVSSKNGENALHSLLRRAGQTEAVQYFLDKEVDINQADEDGNTAFMNAAASNRDDALIALLLPRVKNINQANLQGVTALAMAVKGNSPEVVKLLLSKGADVNAVDKMGNNLAYYLLESYQQAGGRGGAGGQGASRPVGQGAGNGQGTRPGEGQQGGGAGFGGQAAVNAPKPEDFDNKLQALKENGFAVTTPQKSGATLYHLAVAKNDMALVKRLQPLGIDINARDKEGLTALHKAALISKDDALLNYLLSLGAKKDIKTNFGETAFDLASENDFLSKNNVSVTFLK